MVKSTRIDRHVAHHTGQVELADAIQEGLHAAKAGDERTATVKLGRAVQLAAASGHEDTCACCKGRRRRRRRAGHGAAAEGRREGGRDDARHPVGADGPARQEGPRREEDS